MTDVSTIQWIGTNYAAVASAVNGVVVRNDNGTLTIPEIEGDVHVRQGDWIVVHKVTGRVASLSFQIGN